MSTPINWDKVLQLNSPANDAETMLQLLRRWLGIVWFPGVVVVLLITLLIASVVYALASALSVALVVVIGALLSAVCVAMLIFWGALSVLNDARYSNNTRTYQWVEDKKNLRKLALEQLAIEREKTQIDVRINKGGMAQFGDISNTVNADNRVLILTGEALLKHASHFEEFVRQLPIRGAERSAWVPDSGDSFQWQDGTRTNQGEYKALRIEARAAGLIEGQGRGRKAKVIDVSPEKS